MCVTTRTPDMEKELTGHLRSRMMVSVRESRSFLSQAVLAVLQLFAKVIHMFQGRWKSAEAISLGAADCLPGRFEVNNDAVTFFNLSTYVDRKHNTQRSASPRETGLVGSLVRFTSQVLITYSPTPARRRPTRSLRCREEHCMEQHHRGFGLAGNGAR